MARHVYCSKCNVYLGEIRDARLRKDIVMLCGKCNAKMKAQESVGNYGDVPDFLKGLFK
jgi:RNase P subunit RPR2